MRRASSLLSDSLFLTGAFAILVTVILGVFCFALSYRAMQEFAKSSGAVVAGLDYIWPLTVDFAMIVFGLTSLFKTMQGQHAIWQRLLVLLFAALSMLFNVLHSPRVWSSQIAAAVPPFSLVLALESLLSIVTSIIKKQATDLQRALAMRDATIRQNDAEIETLQGQVAELQSQLQEQSAMPMIARRGARGNLDSAVLQAYIAEHPNETSMQVATALQISKSTVDHSDAWRNRRNGHGY